MRIHTHNTYTHMSLSSVVKKFANNCKLDVSNPKAILNRFLTLQVNAASWEHTYGHATKEDGGKDLSRFKYDAKNGVINAYVRMENCHKFEASVWRKLFQGATISEKLMGDDGVKQKLAVFYDFVAKVVDPINSHMTVDKKLMLFFLMNTKKKNLRNLIYDSELGLGLRREQKSTLYTQMSEYNMKDDTTGSLAKEIGTLIAQMELPVGANNSGLHMDLKMPLGKAVTTTNTDVGSTNISRECENKIVYNIKPSRAEGWDDAKELVLGENSAIKLCKKQMKLRFAPNKDLAHQLIFSAISPNPNHWMRGSGVPLQNGKLALATQVRDSMSEMDSKDWTGLLKVVGYGDTKHAAKSANCADFFQHLAKAIPQAKRKYWTSKDLVQMFVTAHLPNWQQHWKENWEFNPNVERAVKRYIHEHPVPSDEFVQALAEGI